MGRGGKGEGGGWDKTALATVATPTAARRADGKIKPVGVHYLQLVKGGGGRGGGEGGKGGAEVRGAKGGWGNQGCASYHGGTQGCQTCRWED